MEKKGTEKRKPTDFSRDFSSDSAAEFVDKQMKARAMDIWFGLPRGAFCSKCASRYNTGFSVCQPYNIHYSTIRNKALNLWKNGNGYSWNNWTIIKGNLVCYDCAVKAGLKVKTQ